MKPEVARPRPEGYLLSVMAPLERYHREIAHFGPSRAQLREWLLGRAEAESPEVSRDDVENYINVFSADSSGAFPAAEPITEVA